MNRQEENKMYAAVAAKICGHKLSDEDKKNIEKFNNIYDEALRRKKGDGNSEA